MNDSVGATELWELVRAQQERIDALEAKLAPAEAPVNETKIGRRAVFGLAGVGVAAAAAMVVRPDAAAAADGGPLLMGVTTNLASSPTQFIMENVTGDGLSLLKVGGSSSESAVRAVMRTEGTATLRGIGVTAQGATGVQATGSTVGVQGIGTTGYGGTFSGEGVGQIRLIPSSLSGPGVNGQVGSLHVDSLGDLYLCTVAGSPGTWVKLNAPQGPTFLPVSKRGFDSRTGTAGSGTKGKFTAAETRTVNIATDTGIPAGKSAAIINITVVNTSAPEGFVSVYSGAVTLTGEPTFSNINWFGASQILANSATTAISPTGTIKIFASAPTDVIIDVVGHYS